MSDSEPPHGVEWAGPARRSIERVPDAVAVAIIEFVYGAIAENPRRAGLALRWELEGLHSARRGDYRIVYRIDGDRHVIVIEAIGHRADIYRRR